MNIKISIITNSGKEVNLTDRLQKLNITKSPLMFVPQLQFEVSLDNSFILSKDFQTSTKLFLQIQTNKEDTENSPISELLNWENWEIASISNASIINSNDINFKFTGYTNVQIIASIPNSIFSKKVANFYFENDTVNNILKKILTDQRIAYISPNNEHVDSLFIPNMRNIEALSYVLTNYYNSYVFFLYDFDGIYIYSLEDIINNFTPEYEIMYLDKDENITNPKKIKVFDLIDISNNLHYNLFSLPKIYNILNYLNDKFVKVDNLSMQNIVGNNLGKIDFSMYKDVKNDVAFSAQERMIYYSNLLNSNVISIYISKIFLFSKLRPGLPIYLNTVHPKYLSLKGKYIITNMVLNIIKDQNINTSMVLTLSRYGYE